MNTIYIPKIDTANDWFDGAVEAIAEATGSEPVWAEIDADDNSDGYLAGYFMHDGILYRGRYEPSRSDDESDCVTFAKAEPLTYGWVVEPDDGEFFDFADTPHLTPRDMDLRSAPDAAERYGNGHMTVGVYGPFATREEAEAAAEAAYLGADESGGESGWTVWYLPATY